MRIRTLAPLAALALAACGSTVAPPPPQAAEPAAASSPTRDDGLPTDPVERAKAVEGEVLEQKEQLDKALEEQGG